MAEMEDALLHSNSYKQQISDLKQRLDQALFECQLLR